MSEAPSSPSIDISNRILMEFYGEIFRLYPNISSIQESLNEDEQAFSCTFTLREPVTDHEITKMRHGLLGIITQKILPTLPSGYKSQVGGIVLEMPEKPEDVAMGDFCDVLKNLFPEIAEIHYGFIGDTVSFDIVGSISPIVKANIRDTLIERFPLWESHQPRVPVFSDNNKRTTTPASTKSRFGTQIRSILERVL